MDLKMWIAVSSMVIALPAFAHDVAKGPNGGRVEDAGAYHLELVAKGAALDVFLTDGSDKPVAPVGFKGLAILLVDRKSQRITLAPAEDSKRLSGKATSSLPAQPKGVIQITAPDGTTAQAKFN